MEVISIGQTLNDAEIADLQRNLAENYSYLRDYRLNVVQNAHEGLDEAAVNEILQNTLAENDFTGIREANSAEIDKYKSLSATYYPAYQKNLEQKRLFERLNQKLPTIFPKIARVEVAQLVDGKRFVIIAYVSEQFTADEASRLKNFLSIEAESPVTLNIQLNLPDAADFVSGNGVNW